MVLMWGNGISVICKKVNMEGPISGQYNSTTQILLGNRLGLLPSETNIVNFSSDKLIRITFLPDLLVLFIGDDQGLFARCHASIIDETWPKIIRCKGQVNAWNYCIPSQGTDKNRSFMYLQIRGRFTTLKS